MIDAVQIAEALAEQVNTTSYLWPNHNGADNPVPHLMTEYTTAKEYVIPEISRKMLSELRIFISPPPETRQESSNDRCGRKWNYMVECMVGKTIKTHDNSDPFQPLELEKIRKMMRLVDSLTDFIDGNRSLIGIGSDNSTGVLASVTQITYDRGLLTESGIFSGVVQATYRAS